MPDTTPPLSSLDAFLAGVERRAFRRALMSTGNRGEALRIVEEAMLRLARGHASRPAAGWPVQFQQSLVNGLRDWQRGQVLRRRMRFWRPQPPTLPEYDPLEAGVAPDALEGSDVSPRGHTTASLEAAIARLPGRLREALELRVWEGLAVAQAAQAMGCSEASVKSQLARALELLRLRLQAGAAADR